jgi:hypothetical protein
MRLDIPSYPRYDFWKNFTGGITMKRLVLIVLSMLFVLSAVSLVLAAKGPTGKFDAKAGDTIYVCSCGDGCDCGSLAKKEGKCGCGKDLVKTTVTKIDKTKVYYTLDGKELSAPIKGKYASAVVTATAVRLARSRASAAVTRIW